MKKPWWGVGAAFAAGVACTAAARVEHPLLMLSNGAQAVGRWLRGLSLSGNTGNVMAWGVCLILTLLPTVYILFARRKRQQASDFLWPLTSLALFAGLYFLINPSLVLRLLPPFIQDSAMAAWFSVFPLYASLSLLLACALLRWTGSLTDSRLIFWLRALLMISMLATGFDMGFTLAAACAHPVTLPPVLADLVTDAFWLVLLDAARTLLSSMEQHGWFHEETERRAKLLAQRAQWSLAAAVCALAARNILVLLTARWLTDINLSIKLPLAQMTLSCGALLIARCLAAACRVKRDNDLMI